MTELRQRDPRILEPRYLAWLRTKPCSCGCGSVPPSDAAHIRTGSLRHGKEHTGGAQKPHDRWAVPLKHEHHMAQHAFGTEIVWWEAHGIDPFALAERYYAAYLADGGNPPGEAIRKAKPVTKKSRARRGPKTRIPSRPFSKEKRGFRT